MKLLKYISSWISQIVGFLMTLSLSQRNSVASMVREFFPQFSEKRIVEATLALEKLQTEGIDKLSIEEKASLTVPNHIYYFSEVEFEERANPNNPELKEKIMKGRAIYPTTSRNLSIYEKDELIKAAPSLKGKPVQRNHSFAVEDTMGTVKNYGIDENGVTTYEAGLDPNDPVTQKASAGYVKHVSVLGKSTPLCNICNEEYDWFHPHEIGKKYDGKIAKVRQTNIEYQHLGVTNYPGIPGASLRISKEMMEQPDEVGGITGSTIESIFLMRESMSSIFSEQSPEYDFSDKGVRGELEMVEQTTQEQKDLARKVEQLLAENEQYKSQMDASKAHAKELEDIMRTDKIAKVLEYEVKLGLTQEDKVDLKRITLNEWATERLNARLDTLKEMDEMSKKNKPDADVSESVRGKSKDFSQQQEKLELTKDQIREAEKEYLMEVFWGPDFVSKTARLTLERYNNLEDKWKTPASIINASYLAQNRGK